MKPGLLWRDARALSKTLRKILLQGEALPRTVGECERVVAAVFPGADTKDEREPCPAALAPTQPSTPFSSTLTVGGSGEGLPLGQTARASWFKKSQSVSLTESGALGQVMVCGCTGAGRTEPLLALALEAAKAGKGVVYLDGKGDTSLYSKALSGLSSLQQAGNLRVLNLMSGRPGEERRGKHTHSLDLFHGFDEVALAGWLTDLPEDIPAGVPVAQVAGLVAKLAMAWGHQTGRRLTPENIGRLCTSTGLMDYSQSPEEWRLPRDLALRVHRMAWGQAAPEGWAQALALLETSLAPLWKTWGHVFSTPAPEFGMGEACPADTSDSMRPTRLFVLVLGPASVAALPMRAITASLRQSLLARARGLPWDTLAVMDEFKYYETPATLAAFSRLRDRGCGVVWGTPEAPVPAQLRAWLDHGWLPPSTHVWMRQCDGHHQPHYDRWLAGRHPGLAIPPPRFLGGLTEGEAVAFDTAHAVALDMGWWDLKLPEIMFIPHAVALPERVDYPAPRPATGLALFDRARAARVLMDRLGQWQMAHSGQAPAGMPLSWCQETLARMLGFAHWHEACRQLSAEGSPKGHPKPPGCGAP